MKFFDRYTKLFKEKFSETSENASKYVDSAKHQVNDSYETVKNTTTENLPKARDAVYKTYDSTAKTVNKFSGSVSRFSRYGRYSMVLAGTGIFLFGVGYAARPIADIYKEQKRK